MPILYISHGAGRRGRDLMACGQHANSRSERIASVRCKAAMRKKSGTATSHAELQQLVRQQHARRGPK
eukprot:CAMPEP_0115461574 /NCGR_PEP_ID=MMETSP0271-20121206/47373_1 /TAXON_ID=71861 /ORGANISM="Scrippsiella trochoidea, Strain CCMP3099" /LENGTH=67 /DNA_ID=CAMNT_0002888323 /DNA_START=76 /DNA_END=276 /DNA_ORIENTATION=-